ncbi:hypothetical protein NDU88_003887 [Pleurodeles waltl]|uniref:Uncharacterized protein n=1 Tax=Pleurodeles waltl TaxID=8319 RepID=A0AAV7NHZ0_PLEWA|nr:hypothetical protein NDU88_003887 [Pleurodeles waltl]
MVLTIAGSFRQAQQEDPTLKNAWQQALYPDGRSLLPTEASGGRRSGDGCRSGSEPNVALKKLKRKGARLCSGTNNARHGDESEPAACD